MAYSQVDDVDLFDDEKPAPSSARSTPSPAPPTRATPQETSVPPTNRLAVIALVLSFLGITWLPGVVCGHIARSQIARNGQLGGSYALAALWIGYFYAAVTITGTIVYLMIA